MEWPNNPETGERTDKKFKFVAQNIQVTANNNFYQIDLVRSLPMTRNRSQAPHTLAINNYRHKSRHSKCCKESLEFNRALNKVVTTEIDTQTMMKMMKKR